MGKMRTEAKAAPNKAVIRRMNELAAKYANTLSDSAFFSAFSRANFQMENQPQIQNSRIKAISSLPVDYTKDQIGEFLRQPYTHERELRETAEILRWTNYPFFKINKTFFAACLSGRIVAQNATAHTSEHALDTAADVPHADDAHRHAS